MSNEVDRRRKYVRYPGSHAEVVVDNHVYSIHDWSVRGACFEALPHAPLSAGDHVQVTLKFRFLHDTISIQQKARVLRTAKRGVAIEFPPLMPMARRQFDRVLDSLHATNFLESQIA